ITWIAVTSAWKKSWAPAALISNAFPADRGRAQHMHDGQRPRSIVRIELDERSFLRRRPEVEHEREVALFDLLEENTFTLTGAGAAPSPYHLRLALREDRLVFDVRDAGDAPQKEIVLPVRPFRSVIKDYFMVCENYFDAIKTSSPSQIEAIDMGRRA